MTKRTTLIRNSLVSSAMCLLTACGGGGGGGTSGSPPAPVNQSVGGIWQTQYTESSGPTAGDSVGGLAIVDETGSLYFAESDQTSGCTEVGFGQMSVTGSSISGNVNVALVKYATVPGVNTSCTFPDGSTSGTGTLSGTIAQRSSMTITSSGPTSAGNALPTETHTWTFSSLYDNPSSLSAVAANYSAGSNTLSINGDGALFEQDPTTGCVINGQISIINSQYNAYSLSLTFSNCSGSAAAANGVTMSGLATLDTTANPAQLDFGVSTSANGSFAVLVDSLAKQ